MRPLFEALAAKRFVLLGEQHDAAEQHRWQHQTLAGLLALHPQLVVGFESFPRSAQPVLERWRNGELSAEAFLEQSRWSEVWGFPPELYLPLFHFVRQNRLPMVALNVERELIAEVGKEGWAAVPADARQGLGDPAPAAADYRRRLVEVYRQHLDEAADPRPAVEAIFEEPAFARFVEAQLAWDRAMAEGLVAAARDHPGALVVGIIGRGHLEHGSGVPHQLRDLGVAAEEIAVLLPLDVAEACEEAIAADFADAVFLFEAPPEPATAAAGRPRLGVRIEPADGGVRVIEVVAGSVAEVAGLAAGDLLTAAAGRNLQAPAELVAVVGRQAPGTWLPLRALRAGEALELVAKFPAEDRAEP